LTSEQHEAKVRALHEKLQEVRALEREAPSGKRLVRVDVGDE
jgi:hypothetical protein